MGDHFRAQDNYVQIIELTPALRSRIEATVEHLLALLDAYHGDPDLELEPDLEGSLAGFQTLMSKEGAAACDLEEDQSDYEPSLGWLHWSDGRPRLEWDDDGSDREEENEHNEDGANDEPSIGWNLDGFFGSTFDTDEREIDHEDGNNFDEDMDRFFAT